MLFSCFSFAIMGGIIKKLSRLDAWEVVFFRSLVNMLWLLPWVLRHPESAHGWKAEIKTLLLRGVSGCASMFLYFYAIEHIKLADAVMLNYASPIWVLVLSGIFLKERLSAKSIACILVSLLGVSLILKPDFKYQDHLTSMAALAGFLSSFSAAIAYVSIKVATRTISTRFIVFTFSAISTLLSLVPMLFTFISPTPLEWIMLAFCGSFATIAQAAMTKAYAGLPASIASPLQLSTVIFSGILGWIFWGEVPDSWSIFGGFLVLFGLIGAYADLKFRSKPAIAESQIPKRST